MFDGGTRVPLIIRGPAVTAPGSVANELVSAVDLFPTLLAMCGISYPSPALASIALPLDGVSFLPALVGQAGYGRSCVYSEVSGTYLGQGYTLRTTTHRLIRYTLILEQHQEFFDLIADPLETTNLLVAPLSPTAAVPFDGLMATLETIRDDGWAEAYGTGCAGAAGVPLLRTQTQARIGTLFHTRVEGTAASTTAIGTIIGVTRSAPLPFDLQVFGAPGCQLAVFPLLLIDHNLAGYSPGLMIPYAVPLYGTEFYVQGIVAEPGVNQLGAIWSRGLRCIIGR
jgi:hypothetical protein